MHAIRSLTLALSSFLLASGLAGCVTVPSDPTSDLHGQQLAPIDLPRYMGSWYNIAHIPYFAERGYVASISEWHLREDGAIDDLFIGRKGSFDAPLTRYHLVDRVVPGTGNARWTVELFWPLVFAQLTRYVDPDYQYTVLGYPDRSLAWILSRTPHIEESRYRQLLDIAAKQGYDTTLFRRVPQFPDDVGKPGFLQSDE